MKDNTLLYLAGGILVGYLFTEHIGRIVGPVLGAPFGQVKKVMRMPIGQQQRGIMQDALAERQDQAQTMMMPH